MNMVKFNPQMLILGRESRQLTQSELAKKLGITQGKLSKMESDLLPVTTEDLLNISNVLSYPVEFFGQSQQVYGLGISEFYHRKRQSVTKRCMGKIYAQTNIRRMHLTKLFEGLEFDECKIFRRDLDEYDEKVEKIAQIARLDLALPRGPVQNLAQAIENAGGIIIHCNFDTRLLDALSRWFPGLPPMFFMNQDLPGDRMRFTLAHELGHLIMHRTTNPDMEKQADRFAAEFLMPKDDIRPYLNDLSLSKLVSLKELWKVSMGAILKRAEDLKKITNRQAKYLWMQMSKSGFRTHEPFDFIVPIEDPSYLKEIIETYSQEMGYSPSDLSKFLFIHEEELPFYYPIALQSSKNKNHLSLI